MSGAITQNIDVAQVVLYAFWAFFALLILYLRREDKREGYPLEPERADKGRPRRREGFPSTPETKVFTLADGSRMSSGRPDTREINAEPIGPYPGAPLEPTGDPLRDGVGPAAYAERAMEPDLTSEGEPKIAPLRVATDFSIETQDPDPRGWPVVAADKTIAGTVRDVWVDRSEYIIRYLEVEAQTSDGSRNVLLPMTMAQVRPGWRSQIYVDSIVAQQFAGVPAHQNPDQVTLREEDQISAYFAGGHLYATPDRAEPFI